MKSILKITGVAILLIGCNNPQPNKTNQCKIEGVKAPQWICNNVDDNSTIYAMGYAHKSPLGISFEENEAISMARDSLSRRVSVKVKNMIKTYLESTGIKDSQTAERVTTQVSKQLSKTTLNGSKLKTFWISPKGNMFVLVGISRNNLINGVSNSVKTTFHNDEALWQEFKAKKAQEELDAEIDKEFKSY